MLWDLFCRVIDNFGDVGVCWRLARELDARGERVRLWIDDPSALAWMAPGTTSGHAGPGSGSGSIQVVHWTDPAPIHSPRDVVVEAFGCDPPNSFVRRMAQRAVDGRAPAWIDLEYLSAEAYVGRSHGLPSPQQAGPGAGLVKWFYYPGFDATTGGLIRERNLTAHRRSFDKQAWLNTQRIEHRSGECLVSLFCYSNAALPQLLESLSQRPTLLLVAPGAAAAQVGQELGAMGRRGHLRALSMPFLEQDEFDHLLWASDLNFVRGEDSFVRAQWAGRPFVWQAYPQTDAAHDVKITAFLDRLLHGASPATADPIRALHRRWNGGGGRFELPSLPEWARLTERWREHLARQPDLVSGLIKFAAERQ